MIKLEDIVTIPELGLRDDINKEAVKLYAENHVYKTKPVILFRIHGYKGLVLVDGKHRIEAAIANGEDVEAALLKT